MLKSLVLESLNGVDPMYEILDSCEKSEDADAMDF
jgi:hypothetical protein